MDGDFVCPLCEREYLMERTLGYHLELTHGWDPAKRSPWAAAGIKAPPLLTTEDDVRQFRAMFGLTTEG
jgi:hypothetical protein